MELVNFGGNVRLDHRSSRSLIARVRAPGFSRSLNTRVLEQARKELSAKASITFKAKPKREGRKTVGWFFEIRDNKPKRGKLAGAVELPEAAKQAETHQFDARIASAKARWEEASKGAARKVAGPDGSGKQDGPSERIRTACNVLVVSGSVVGAGVAAVLKNISDYRLRFIQSSYLFRAERVPVEKMFYTCRTGLLKSAGMGSLK